MTQDSTNDPQPNHQISKTAIWVAAARAVGAREPDKKTKNPDHLAAKLLGDPATLGLQHPVIDAFQMSYEQAMQNFEVANLVRAMIVRTRFIGEALQRAVAQGAAQVLILGAGLDSHAYRYQDLLSQTKIFEVDRPATLAFKEQRVSEVLGSSPQNLSYAPIDFERQDLADALAQRGYDPSQKTFVIMEGVTMYLHEEAIQSTFQFVASHASGTRIVFDMATQAMVEHIKQIDIAQMPEAARPSMENFLAVFRNEPWVFWFPMDNEEEYMNKLGLTLDTLLIIDSEESVKRYLTRTDGTIIGADAYEKYEALRDSMQIAAENMTAEQLQAFREQMKEQQRQMAYRIAEAVVE